MVDQAAARDLWVSTRATHAGDNRFTRGKLSTRINDERRAAMMHTLIALKPGWAPVAEIATDAELLAALCHQGIEGVLDLHASPPPFTLILSDRPVASTVARMQVADGQRKIVTLGHRMIEIEHDGVRALLALLDGSRDRGKLEHIWAGLPGADAMPVSRALDLIRSQALLTA